MSSASVHIVTYNSAEYIADCIQSVLKQRAVIDKIIVIDNASTDDTVERVRQWGDRVVLVTNETNTGFAAAHNQAMAMSESDYYLVLNPDVMLDPDYLLHIMNFMDQHPEVGSCTGKLVLRSQPGLIDSAGLTINKSRRAFDRGAYRPQEEWDKAGDVFGVSGAAAVYSRKMVEDVSINGRFFDEDFFAYKEDVDVAWRSRLLGWSAAYVPQAFAYHERGWKQGERAQRPLRIRRHSYINRYRMMMKNDSFFYMMKHFWYLAPYEVFSLLYFLVREPKVLAAWAGFWKDFAKLREARRIIQSKRRSNWGEVYKYFE